MYIIIGFCLIQDWDRQNPTQIVTEICGFITILSGTFLLHKTKDAVDGVFSLFFVDILSNSLLVPRWNQLYLKTMLLLQVHQHLSKCACLSTQTRTLMIPKVCL